jgi:DNA-directed RNA polymerase subunit beta'
VLLLESILIVNKSIVKLWWIIIIIRFEKRFNKISIGLASPESIKESRGEARTINYRTHKPERDGLFCERIDFECACGKYKRIVTKESSVTGVKLLRKKYVEIVGHINLVVPIAHIWYFRSLPNKIGYILVFHLRN